MARRIYMDYASTTPLDKRILKMMLPYFTKNFGNPSAIYTEGTGAKKVVEAGRKKIAELLNLRSEEIFFTASGTESDNMTLFGVTRAVFSHISHPHIITTSIEHPGILEACKALEKMGVEVTYVGVEENGIVDPLKIKAALKENTVLVSVMYANNEIGTIQPLREISRTISDFRNTQSKNIPIPYFHTDASQAANYCDLSFQKLGIDMMTLDASKIYGPKGVGLLAVRRHVDIKPLIYGGGQEKGLRSGTENVAGIIGMAEALVLAQSIRERESGRLKKLQDYFISHVINYMPGVFINGDQEKRLPNNVNICIPHLDAEFAVIKLDSAGISCSSASSCLNLSEEPYSYVLESIYRDNPERKNCKNSSLRFTFGRATTKREIDLTLKQLASIMLTQ